jgi:hypothetical protein
LVARIGYRLRMLRLRRDPSRLGRAEHTGRCDSAQSCAALAGWRAVVVVEVGEKWKRRPRPCPIWLKAKTQRRLPRSAWWRPHRVALR